MSFWRELKRRNVFRVTAIYLAVAWLIAQIISVINEPLSLPDWFDTTIILLLAAGLPVAIVLAWALELTPEGVRLDEGSAQKTSKQVSAGRTIDFAIIAALVVALGLTLWNRDPPAPENSIAVLRFTNQSEDPAQSYLSTGIASEILNRLIPIDGLIVAGENSSFQFEAGSGDYQGIGEALNVAYVLEGSFLNVDGRIRVRARLVSADDGIALWTETFEDQGRELLDILPEVAITVANSLSVELGVRESQLRYSGTDSREAFDYFLRGREIWRTNPPQAIEEFTNATRIDPNFAEPWAWMSSSYGFVLLSARSQQEFDRAYAGILSSAQRAVEVGPGLWDAYSAQAWALLGDQNPIAAHEAFATAVDLARSTGARMAYQHATWVEIFGRLNEAVERLEALRDIDPLNQENSLFLVNALTVMGRYEEARAEADRSDLEFGPNLVSFASLPYFIEIGDSDRIRDVFAGAPPGTVGNLLAPVVGDREGTLATIRSWLASPEFKRRPGLVNASFLAGHYHDSELAVELLRAAFLTDGWGQWFMIWHDVLSATRQTPQFKQFLRDLGFVDLFLQTGEWNDYCHPLPGGDDFECV